MAARILTTALVASSLAACDTKPAAKPAPAAPTTAAPAPAPKPAESKPAAPAKPETSPVAVAGQTFNLEVALDDAVRIKGLGGRTSIDARGGMLFVFPQPFPLDFIMRDCPIAIDIAFLDGSGRVLTKYEMKPEAPRAENETLDAYENRLKRYSSRYPAQFAAEFAAGTLETLKVKEGDLFRFDAEALKRRAR